MRCPYCGRKNPNDARRCIRCGRRLNGVRERRREQKILILGILLIILILAAGIAAMLGMSKILKSGEENSNQPQKVKIVTTPKPATKDSSEREIREAQKGGEAPVPDPDLQVTSPPIPTEPPQEPSPAPDLVTAALADDNRKDEIASMGYSLVEVSSAEAASTIQQDGVDNSPIVLTDGYQWSSWQEGVDGDGIGENITLHFDKTYNVKFLVLRLGNWYSSGAYYAPNGRPQTMTFELGTRKFQVTFPDEMKEFCVELSEEVEASSLKMTIDGVYKGTQYDDTCINEVDLYGAPQ
jgi:predicted nucleic acid-binding Zn ribbon protein